MIDLKRHSQRKTPAVANGFIAADDIRVNERTRPYREADAPAELCPLVGGAVPVHSAAHASPVSLRPNLSAQSHPPVVAKQRIVRRAQVGIDPQRGGPDLSPLPAG